VQEDVMKTRLETGILAILSLLFVSCSGSDVSVVYKHPSLNIQFKSHEGWTHLPRPEDELIYEVVDPEKIVHVVLWYTSTEQSGSAYLLKMADMKGLALGENDKPESQRIQDHPAWTLRLPGYEGENPIHSILTVISCGKSPKHPRENSLYIIEIWCAEEYHEQKKKLMESILAGIEIM
jgi:hypothetical protein